MSDQAIRAREHRISWQFGLPVFVGGLIFVLMILAGHRLLNDPDIYWHITVGDWIAAHRAFPHEDPFSLTMAGKPWIAKEWASQLIFAAAYGVAGWAGIVVIAASAIALTFALLARFLSRELSPIPAIMLVMGALLLAAPHLVARPHVLAMPFMVLWVGGLVGAADRARAPSLFLLPLMTMWANLHAGFTFGLALIIPLAIERVWQAKAPDRMRTALLWLRFSALAFAAACITPYGPGSMLMTFRVLGLGPALQIVSEWKPQDFTHIGVFEVVLLCAIGFALYRGIKLPPMRLILALGLLHMALAHVRNSELFALVVPLVVARPLNAQLGAYAKENCESDIGIAPFSLRAILAIALVSLSAFAWLAGALVEMAPSRQATPKAAVDAISAASISRILNDYDFGGYLVARGLKPFIDGRTELYGGKFTAEENGAVTLQDLPGFLKLLDQYGIQATLLNP
ncbi:MAG: hypothetical protein WAW96_00620, partial [Alphaproteobacteria bacterium]